MGALGTGLWLLRRHGAAAAVGSRPDLEPGAAGGGPDPEAGAAGGTPDPQAGAAAGPAGTAGGRPHWLRLGRHYAGTAIGGYLLLMAVVILYYYGVARVGGAFIVSAFTGCALLIALATPVFLVASWLAERRLSRPVRPAAWRAARRPTCPTSHSLITRPRLRS